MHQSCGSQMPTINTQLFFPRAAHKIANDSHFRRDTFQILFRQSPDVFVFLSLSFFGIGLLIARARYLSLSLSLFKSFSYISKIS